MVIRSQTKEADHELAGEIIKNLETIVKSSEMSAGSLKLIQLPDVTIDFVCEEGISYYDLGNGVSKDIPYDMIFSQAKLSGTELISWTQSWNLPFRIGMFQYLTTRRAQYLIVQDGTYAKDLFDMLPSNITKKLIKQTDEIPDNNFDYYKIIQFKEFEHTGYKPDENVHTITIEVLGDDLDSYGKVTFENSEEINFLKKESLFGAIFSEDIGFYNCTMNKAFERLETLMTLNINRTDRLKDETDNERCTTILGYSSTEMDYILDKTLVDAEFIYESSEKLARDNQNLIRGKNCPLIY